MRPKFVLILMFITLGFFLILLNSPGLWHRKALGSALGAWIQNPTTENRQAIEVEKQRAKRGQYLVCGLAVLNVIAIIVYGGLRQRKRLA